MPTKERAQDLIRRGELVAAKTELEGLVAATGADAEAWYLLAVLHQRMERDDAAVQCYEKVVELEPRHAGALYYLGNIHGKCARHEAAAACFARALRLQPRSVDIARNLGATLQHLGRIVEAIDCYRAFLSHTPGAADIHYNLGNALADAGLHSEAIASYRQALAIDPGYADARVNLGAVLDESGNLDAATAEYEQAGVVSLLAGAYADQGRAAEAVACYGRARDDAALTLASAMVLPVIPASVDDMQHWRDRFDREVTRLSEHPPTLTDPLTSAARTSFYLSYQGLDNRELHAKVARLYERACPALRWQASHTPARRERLRIGFISRYLYEHSIGRTSRGVMAKLPRERYEVVALFVPPVREDQTSRFIRANSDRAVVLPRTLDAARRAVAELELDVLFYQDIGMEPFTYFLAFSRLAPVQCVSFGHPDTSGIPAIDYFVSNDLYETEGAQAHYSERLFLLRNLGTLAYYYRPPAPPALPREELGLPSSGTLYLCPQTLFKVHPTSDAVLARIREEDPAARLVFIEGRSANWGRLLRQRFAKSFSDAIFLPRQSPERFASVIAACDVLLDTPHFNGMNTSLEAFAVGKAIVTMPTAFQRGRHTTGMYRKMGFTECVAQSGDEYARIALRLGKDEKYRRHVEHEIAARCHVLFEDAHAVSEFERFFEEAVR